MNAIRPQTPSSPVSMQRTYDDVETMSKKRKIDTPPISSSPTFVQQKYFEETSNASLSRSSSPKKPQSVVGSLSNDAELEAEKAGFLMEIQRIQVKNLKFYNFPKC